MNLEPLDSLIPASYNPRTADPHRLDLVQLSLRKLGWLLPVYATPENEILSGHQRTLVARDLGYTVVPVVRTQSMPEHLRKAVNILFNRATNDMDQETTPTEMTRALAAERVSALAASLPDHPVDVFPCMTGSTLNVAPFLKRNAGRWLAYALNVSKSLRKFGIVQPIVVDPDGLVINGIGRLQTLAEKGETHGYFITVDRDRAAFAQAMLNLLSMDFDIHNRYADLLRYNSFRRARRVRKELGRGFVFAVIGDKPAYNFDINNPEHRKRWTRIHGTTVLDFGAGHLQETEMLRRVGIDCTPFEPYRLGPDGEIDKAEGIALARDFLRAVAAGKVWDSIFLASVLNSVPFEQDRKHIVKICAALCSRHTRLYAVASSIRQSDFLLQRQFINAKRSGAIKFFLDYEPNITLGEIQDKPKVQRYHDPEQFYRLFKSAFRTVRASYDSSGVNVAAVAQDCKGFDGLRDALVFEFDLPYPDGSRMGLAQEAVEAFSRRLGLALGDAA